MKPVRVLFATMLAILLFGQMAVVAQDATPVPSNVSAETREYVDVILSDAEQGFMPGVVVFIDGPNQQMWESAGVGNLETNEPIDPTADFQIGSNTKMMTAAMVMQLQEEGLVDVDGLLVDYLPEVAGQFPGGDFITIRMLLNHTSGLYDVVEDMAASIFVDWHLNQSTDALTQAWTMDQAVAYSGMYRGGNAYFGPGDEDQWHYTNTGYFILGLLIEEVTGLSYSENIQTRIFEPLGMDASYYSDGVWQDPTRGYYQYPFDFDTSDWNLTQGAAAGAVVSSLEDMAVFMRTLFKGELFTDPATLAMMQETVAAPALLAYYGLGIIDFGGNVWGHGGQTLGFYSHTFYNLDTDTIVIAWTNTASPVSTNLSIMQFSLSFLTA